MIDAFVTVSTKSTKREVFDIVCSIFRDSFSRRILFANYMAPRIVGDAELTKGAKIEALVQNKKKDVWAEGTIEGLSEEMCAINFNFDTTAYHQAGRSDKPRADLNRRAEFIFLCKDGQGGLCDLEIGVLLEQKRFGGVSPQHMVMEIIRFLDSQDLEIGGIPGIL